MSPAAKSRLDVTVVAILMAAGLAVTGFGLWQQDWPSVLAIKGFGSSAGYLYSSLPVH